MSAGIAIGSMIALVLGGVPIAFALGLAGVLVLLIQGTVPLAIVPVAMFDGANSFPYIAIPLFMVAGELMNHCDLSRRLIAFASSLVGFIAGGLAHVTVVTSMFFAEISGSAVADAAALGSILIPEMHRKGYNKAFATALVSCASTMAILIPPSIPMILYAVIAGESVNKMLMAGMFPGILVGITLMMFSYVIAKKEKYPVEQNFSLKEVWRTFKEAFWALMVPAIILGGILFGIFTATEAAAVAVVVAFLIGTVIYRKLNLSVLPSVLLSAAKQTSVVMLLISASALLGWYLTNDQIPQKLASAFLSISNNKWLVLAMLNVFFLIVGMFLHSTAAIIMLVPLLMPLVKQVGIDPIHFGAVLTMNLGIGQQTPPVASVLITTCAIAKMSIQQVFRYLRWFILALLIVLAIVTYIPDISLTLPRLIK
ncbi:MAG: TRAP transporter large permease [Desulfitobacterium hafniense]|nr:TRAP transporter large permease [Desulfitobacterium hafniense]